MFSIFPQNTGFSSELFWIRFICFSVLILVIRLVNVRKVNMLSTARPYHEENLFEQDQDQGRNKSVTGEDEHLNARLCGLKNQQLRNLKYSILIRKFLERRCRRDSGGVL